MDPARPYRLLMWRSVLAIPVLAVLLLIARAGQDVSSTTVPLRLIVVNSEADAGKLLQQLDQGADFAVLAREKSIDATSLDGGFLGNVDPASLRAELRDAIKSVEPGGTSRVFKLPAGFAILKVLRQNEVADVETRERPRQSAISAEGSVRFDFDISGLNEAESALANFTKPDGWYLDLASACAMHQQSYAAVRERAAKLLDPANAAQNAGRQPVDIMSMRVAQGQLHAYHGEMAEAIAPWELAYQIAGTDLPRALPYLEELLGIGYLHKSEMENEVYRNPGERCLF